MQPVLHASVPPLHEQVPVPLHEQVPVQVDQLPVPVCRQLEVHQLSEVGYWTMQRRQRPHLLGKR